MVMRPIMTTLPRGMLFAHICLILKPGGRKVDDWRRGIWNGDSVYLGTYANGGLGLSDFAYFKELVGDKFPQDIIDKLVP